MSVAVTVVNADAKTGGLQPFGLYSIAAGWVW